jgi:hypothetical protein
MHTTLLAQEQQQQRQQQRRHAIEASHMPSFESHNLKLGYSGTFPDQVKLLKTISVGLVEVTGVCALNPRTHAWSYCIGARDTVIGGRLNYNKETNAIEYR